MLFSLRHNLNSNANVNGKAKAKAKGKGEVLKFWVYQCNMVCANFIFLPSTSGTFVIKAGVSQIS